MGYIVRASSKTMCARRVVARDGLNVRRLRGECFSVCINIGALNANAHAPIRLERAPGYLLNMVLRPLSACACV